MVCDLQASPERKCATGLEVAVFATADPRAILASLSSAVESAVGSAPVSLTLFEASAALVYGFALADGREVVVKASPQDRDLGFLRANRTIHRQLASTGYPVPAPMSDVLHLAGGYAVIDAFTPAPLAQPVTGTSQRLLGLELAGLVKRCAGMRRCAALRRSLGPWPPESLWGARVRPEINLHDRPAGAEWIDDYGRRALRLAAGATGREVIGHNDWLPHNVRFTDAGELAVVYDCDSIALAPETFLVGKGCVAGSVQDARVFIEAYEGAVGRVFASAERAGIAGVATWMLAFLARWEHSQNLPSSGLRENLAELGDEMLAL